MIDLDKQINPVRLKRLSNLINEKVVERNKNVPDAFQQSQ